MTQHPPHSSHPSDAALAINQLKRKNSLLLPAIISVSFFLILAYVARTHTFGTYSTETDFYHFYAPDAERLAVGQFPDNTFQGPGYPAMLALTGKLTGDLFVAGKWVSLVCAAVVGFFTFLVFARAIGYWVGVGAQLIVLVSKHFPEFGMSATTDMFFLMLCLAALVVFTTESLPVRWRTILTAVLTSLTYLTRYNGLFLLATFVFGIVAFDIYKQSRRVRLGLAALFCAVFLLVSAPWLYANYKQHGSPIYNTNYLNIATEFYPELVNDNVVQEGTRKLGEVFRSFGDVLSYAPRRIASHYPVNLYESVYQSVTDDLVSPWVGWLALIGVVLALIDWRSTPLARLLLFSGVIYMLLLALTHWETRYYFYMLPLYAGLAVYAAVRLLELARARGFARQHAFVLAPLMLVSVMVAHSFMSARNETARFLASHPREVLKACDYFRQANITGSIVVARKPHVAYICGQRWVFFPQVKSLDELKVWLEANRVDYLTISSVEISRRRELAMLKDPRNAPPWLRAVWVNSNPAFVLYQPRLDETIKP
ncbi:MAG: glycosyltransferase family 39 protein [Acidobacteriota bacterium]|nr:glycosyltransferase family 39 protein [Acidobacteriota bacterium]